MYALFYTGSSIRWPVACIELEQSREAVLILSVGWSALVGHDDCNESGSDA